jgi:bifunctional non-homologous end joining protein LigD
MDIFEAKKVTPMLIDSQSSPFDSNEHIFELKLDGERSLSYLDNSGTELRNKRNLKTLMKFPELSRIHEQVNVRCLLDGELYIAINGKPDFSEVQRRSLMSNTFKIELAAKNHPASFCAYDILYFENKDVTNLPLMERKALLEKVIIENERLSISRFIDEKGIDLYNLTVEQDLEGIVAKKKDSKYYPGKKTTEWIKIKNLQDDDFIICGYIPKEKGIVSLILGQFEGNALIHKGHVPLGMSSDAFNYIKRIPVMKNPIFKDKNAVYIEPSLICTVKYMMLNKNGSMRQPVFKGLRFDKTIIK